ncbi:MAG: hypothetical protein IPH50_14400 [Rhodanobacteraceae bacterium]|nr:hypothetical protein [Rhodanobacteraceae bacterium]
MRIAAMHGSDIELSLRAYSLAGKVVMTPKLRAKFWSCQAQILRAAAKPMWPLDEAVARSRELY